jgi:uncharacterized protein YegL
MALLETPKNLLEKTLACLVVDRSGSMEGAPLRELNAGLRSFLTEIEGDSTLAQSLEVAIVAFDDTVEVLHGPALAEDIRLPEIAAGGTTKIVNAITQAIAIVEERKAYYKATSQPYKLPWIIVITDGAPDSDQDVAGMSHEIEQLTKASKFMLLTIGVQGADMAVLNTLAGYKKGAGGVYSKVTPVMLTGTKFTEFFEWLSASMSAVVNSGDGQPVQLASPVDSGWGTFPTL